MIHVDVMDGQFVPKHHARPRDREGDPRARRRCRWNLHLMIRRIPIRFIEDFAKAGRDPDINVHLEAAVGPREDRRAHPRLGKKAAVAVAGVADRRRCCLCSPTWTWCC
jgi:pentose-5-phosphate-3-epimerase